MRQRRALLSIVVNAQQGNSIALSSNDEQFVEVTLKNTSSSSSPLGLYNCGVAGCRCEHFTVSDVNKAKNEGYGVCTHCNHGAMYHHQQTNNNKLSKKNLRQNIQNNNNVTRQTVKVDNNDHNSNMTSLVASAAQSVSPLPVPLLNETNNHNNNNTHHHHHLPGSSSSSSSFSGYHMNQNTTSNLVTPYSSTRTSLGGTAKQQEQQQHQHQFSSAARMSLTNILSLVDNLERSAVLKTMKCEEEESTMTTTTTAVVSSTNHAQSRATKCSLLSQALTNLVRACDIVNERIAFLKRLADQNTDNANFSPETCLNERNTLSRRFEQLTQHCTRVKSLLSSVEKSIATSVTKTANHNTNKNVFLLDQSQYQHQQQTTRTQRAPSFSDENMMMHGPVEFHFDQQERRASVSPVDINNANVIKSSTRSSSISSSCCDNNTKPSTTSSSHQLSETLRLCKDCLETTLASSLFCHNCGKPSTTTIAQIRAPSPDPVYE